MPNNSEKVMPINSESDSCEFATVNIKAANCKRPLASIRGCLSVAFGSAYFAL
jgi:hypothetical protein